MKLREELAKIDKRNSVKEAHVVSDDLLRNYVETQLTEMMAILTRLRVDVLLNEQISVDGKKEAEARDKKVSDLESDIAQFVESITVLQKLHAELS